MNRMLVNEIYANSNCNRYECFATIDNYSTLCKKITVGENVTSNEFEMIFPNSVGESKWRLVFYPKGQYVRDKVGNSIGIYLVMLSCEQSCKTLKANIEFQLKSHADACGPVKKVETIFNFSIPTKRWIGEPDFVRKKWLNAKRLAQFCDNDCMVIRCLIEEADLEEISKMEFPRSDSFDNKINGKEIKQEIKQENDSSDSSLEGESVAVDEAANRKSDGNQVQEQNDISTDQLRGHYGTANEPEDDKSGDENQDSQQNGQWTVVDGKKGNNFQHNHNTRYKANNTGPGNSKWKNKSKSKSKKGGKKKK